MTEKISCPALPILAVDDEMPWLNRLALVLERSGKFNHFIKCDDSRKVLELLRRQQVSLVLLDLTMPGLSGEELLPRIMEEHPELPVIILSGMDQLERAVECMKKGAFDYHVKTGDTERLVLAMTRALELAGMKAELRQLRDGILSRGLRHPEAFKAILTRDEKMLAVFGYMEATACSSEPVLVTGPSGVGKELVARAIHDLSRPEGPWVPVNVAGLDDQVFSDTLFGHAKGAFTGAQSIRPGMIETAAGGTLFLDEIGDMSPTSQVKLLRLLQEGEYLPLGSDKTMISKARIVVATNVDLETKSADGLFRKDLLFRLGTHRIEIPPLSARPGDLPLLLEHFLTEAAGSMWKRKPSYPKELPALLSAYAFPGNVRELRAMVYHAVSLHRSGVLSMDSFRKALKKTTAENIPLRQGGLLPATPFSSLKELPSLKEAGDMLVLEAMRRAGRNQRSAAALLGITQPSLSRRLKIMEENGLRRPPKG